MQGVIRNLFKTLLVSYRRPFLLTSFILALGLLFWLTFQQGVWHDAWGQLTDALDGKTLSGYPNWTLRG